MDGGGGKGGERAGGGGAVVRGKGGAERRGRRSSLLLSRPDASFLALLAVLPDCLAALAKARSGGGVWNTPSLLPSFFLSFFLLSCRSIPSQACARPAWLGLPRRFICFTYSFLSTLGLVRMLWTASRTVRLPPSGSTAVDDHNAQRVTSTEMLYVWT